jgi:23S rRNA (cytosine1962-C5)-methyltransferase
MNPTKKPMTKTRAPRPATTKKAPKTVLPTGKDPVLKGRGFSRATKHPDQMTASATEVMRAIEKTIPSGLKPQNFLSRHDGASKAAPFQSKHSFAGGDSSTALGARINRRAADRLRSGHLWVYASDIESLALPEFELPEGDPPALLPVADSRGLLLGTALYSPTSQIALRLVSREAISVAQWLDVLETRLHEAIRRRKPLLDKQNDACRLCFSEADELPGLVADKYGELVILQLLAKGLDSVAVRESCVRVLREELAPAAILERPDPRVRELEGLAAPSSEPLYATGAAALSTEFRLNGLLFHYDANSGQKTGAFLDQRANYAAAAEWARRLGLAIRDGGGRALDVCCYQGGFALHLAEVCAQVTGIDASRASLEVAERNLLANRDRLTAQVEWVEGDAFQILRDWSDAGEKFDAIVLDPPAFAKSMRAVEGAMRGYKELNLRALKMLRPGGLLVTCSCSYHVGWAELEASVTAAAADAHRRVRLLERRGAALDHPVVLNLPETEYLKCLVLEVE